MYWITYVVTIYCNFIKLNVKIANVSLLFLKLNYNIRAKESTYLLVLINL